MLSGWSGYSFHLRNCVVGCICVCYFDMVRLDAECRAYGTATCQNYANFLLNDSKTYNSINQNLCGAKRFAIFWDVDEFLTIASTEEFKLLHNPLYPPPA